MFQAWDQTTGSVLTSYHQPVIGILEPGLDISQTDFEDIFYTNPGEIPNNSIDDDQNGYIDDVMGWNFNDENGIHPIDPSSHGDGVIGVAAARGNNGIGITGINWQAKVLPVSLTNRATNAITIEAYEYFYQMRKRYNETDGEEGAFIVTTNSSFGEDGLFESDVPVYCEMFNKMGSVGILSVGATTNNETNVDNFGDIPSDCSSEQLIIVTSIDNMDDIQGGFGSINVDIAAPGADILTMASNGNFIMDSGTSFATPQVAGLISLAYTLPLDSLQSAITRSPNFLLNAVKSCILETAVSASDLGQRTLSGGYLNANACLKCVSEQFQPANTSSPLKGLNVYPNAATNEINFEFSTIDFSANVHFSIIDYLGKIIAEGDIDPSLGNTEKLNISQLTAGAYVILLEQNGHKTHLKFIKI
nr:S8 family serine peptidase [Membranihabitans maritimus]